MYTSEHWLEPLPERSRSLRHSDAFRLPRPKKAVLSRSPLYASLSLSLSLFGKLFPTLCALLPLKSLRLLFCLINCFIFFIFYFFWTLVFVEVYPFTDSSINLCALSTL